MPAGTPSLSQPRANIQDSVSDVDGVQASLYTLNDGMPVCSTIGPDGRRLANAGDFDLDRAAVPDITTSSHAGLGCGGLPLVFCTPPGGTLFPAGAVDPDG